MKKAGFKGSTVVAAWFCWYIFFPARIRKLFREMNGTNCRANLEENLLEAGVEGHLATVEQP